MEDNTMKNAEIEGATQEPDWIDRFIEKLMKEQDEESRRLAPLLENNSEKFYSILNEFCKYVAEDCNGIFSTEPYENLYEQKPWTWSMHNYETISNVLKLITDHFEAEKDDGEPFLSRRCYVTSAPYFMIFEEWVGQGECFHTAYVEDIGSYAEVPEHKLSNDELEAAIHWMDNIAGRMRAKIKHCEKINDFRKIPSYKEKLQMAETSSYLLRREKEKGLWNILKEEESNHDK